MTPILTAITPRKIETVLQPLKHFARRAANAGHLDRSQL
jgi:hypothetical protein